MIDCLRVMSSGDGSPLLDRALQMGWATGPGLVAVLESLGPAPGIVRASKLVVASSDKAASDAERLLHRLLRAAGISGWDANIPIICRGRRLVADVVFTRQRLVIEVDGWAWHQDVERFRADRERQNLLVSDGWTVLRFTWHDLTQRPGEVIRQIEHALARTAA